MKSKINQLLAAMTCAFLGTGLHAQDSIYERCVEAIDAGDANLVSELADTIRGFNSHPAREFKFARQCVSFAEQREMLWDYETDEFISKEEFNNRQAQKQENQEKIRERNEALQEQRKRLQSDLGHLEKRASCVNAKLSQMNTDFEAINKRFEQSNQALILDETHQACVELYSSDKPAAMINSTCVEAFQRKGHPSLVFSESEQLAKLSAELLELIELEEGLEEELISTKIQLLEAEGVVTKEELNQKVADDLEAKSCAEFGYDGVYLD
ncbi:MAG: hypothetical protein JJ868_18360 [Shimia sp.]|uniref:hypothetical protein n=1 Tax=Shimia sp. TaxID=1954381 RepID=UPI001B2C5F41|nr:hypothetical protein [Shimia sp.]MBO6899331.1 hypothetical protein [Shimia sp.]